MIKESHYSKTFDVEGNKYKIDIVSRGIIMEGSKILVCKNNTNTFLPGGHLEFNDNLKDTLKKEIYEELGMECIIDNYIGCVEVLWEYNKVFHQEIDHVFLVKGITQKTIINSKEDHISFYWMDIENMEKDVFGPINMRKVVKNVYDGKHEIQYFYENQLKNPLL